MRNKLKDYFPMIREREELEKIILSNQLLRVRSKEGKAFSYGQIKNVYLIVIYEESPKEFKTHPDIYYHHSRHIFETGLSLNLLQEFVMIPLDIFRKNMENKPIETPLEAWLTFLSTDEPERIIQLISSYPEFKPMYETLYQLCRNVEQVMGFFSEELRILDRNTVKYMIEEQQLTIEKQAEQLKERDVQIEELKKELELYRQSTTD